ncbi:AraC-type DNA-binding domain-containing proteins [Microbacterium testaceum StLB037]|uniref:AraC-type DNA-binding domain-containing proteins n=1 Tax=Microbacterium testaceum (strain StLB037) TaxID=979556 RepID=E8N7C2_MICTS|nr:AraC family transcriptional regulator [Microbacterium testaceum]BAJ75554.1 AraC-type DNA-binding domain-containing proteins [Microbacterium testaceum StLB037]
MEHTKLETRDAAIVEEMWRSVVPGARISRAEAIQPALNWQAVSDTGFAFCDYTIGSTMLVESDPLDQIVVGRIAGSRVAGTYRRERIDTAVPFMVVDRPLEVAFTGRIAGTAVAFSRTDFDDAARRLSGDEGLRVRATGHAPVSEQRMRYWTRTWEYARDVLLRSSERTPLIQHQARTLMLEASLLSFPTTFTDALAAGRPARPLPAPVRRAKAYIEAHAAESVVLADIAQAARLSPRGLQYAFRASTGRTPMQYLRRVRLDAARADLRSADPSVDTVAAIAARWGFSNLGRFAAMYRGEFGETPSTTLRS